MGHGSRRRAESSVAKSGPESQYNSAVSALFASLRWKTRPQITDAQESKRHRLNSKGAKARRLKGQTLCVFAPLLFIPFHFSVNDFSVLLREIPQFAFRNPSLLRFRIPQFAFRNGKISLNKWPRNAIGLALSISPVGLLGR